MAVLRSSKEEDELCLYRRLYRMVDLLLFHPLLPHFDNCITIKVQSNRRDAREPAATWSRAHCRRVPVLLRRLKSSWPPLDRTMSVARYRPPLLSFCRSISPRPPFCWMLFFPLLLLLLLVLRKGVLRSQTRENRALTFKYSQESRSEHGEDLYFPLDCTGFVDEARINIRN